MRAEGLADMRKLLLAFASKTSKHNNNVSMTTNVKTNERVKFGACEARRRQFIITEEYNNIFSVKVFKKKS